MPAQDKPVAYLTETPFAYPITEREIKEALWAENPNIAFSIPFVAPDQFKPVYSTAQAAFDSRTHFIRDTGLPVLNVDRYEAQLEIVPLDAETVAGNLSQRKQDLVRSIDMDADSIYVAALGNRAIEYAQAESDATAYRAAGYSGDVPGYVQAWATATFKSAQWAADDILSSAQGWRNAQAAIRLNRLTCKEIARNATTFTELDSVEAQWAGFLSAIKTQLGIA